MSQSVYINSHKRKLSSDTKATITNPLDALQKKQRFAYPTRPPSAFWNNLSEIPLTRSALRELDRRNSEGLLRSHRLSRPVTRDDISKWLRPAVSTQYQDQQTHLKRFARQGGPDLTDLRSSNQGRRKRGSASISNSTPTLQTDSTKSISPYDRAFQQHLIDYRIYPDGYKYPGGKALPQPDNLNGISKVLSQRRSSLSRSRFSDSDFQQFKQANTNAFKEDEVISSVIPIIEGRIEDGRGVSGRIRFTNLDHLTDGSLVGGNPDRYYGARPEQLDQRVRAELSGHIIPSTQHDLPIVPNFFLAVKGPDGSLAVAERQACYDGALGARGIRSLQMYGYSDAEPIPDNKAYTITSIYHGGTLKIYTSHLLPSAYPRDSWVYIMTQIDSWSLTGNASMFRQGAAAYRNAKDWAKWQRDEAISKANEKVRQDMPSVDRPQVKRTRRASNLQPSSLGNSDTSADELALDMSLVNRPPRVKRFRRAGDLRPTSLGKSDTSADELAPISPISQPPAATLLPPLAHAGSQTPQRREGDSTALPATKRKNEEDHVQPCAKHAKPIKNNNIQVIELSNDDDDNNNEDLARELAAAESDPETSDNREMDPEFGGQYANRYITEDNWTKVCKFFQCSMTTTSLKLPGFDIEIAAYQLYAIW
ncbi:hypothetical protein NUW58_g9139 [Xylaria curta]|uniref:Uncharacterized protein n=1 Tax=Xylaria curta TaxID=42375 RepID=A0ACC1N176_9PEZI|nr:hypothetical protein NUW58_g9139 [Xylaria curta]